MIRALGIDIFLKDSGQGPPTLFLHGNPDSSDLWAGIIEHLESDFRCLAPDLPGFGRSAEGTDLDYTLDGFADMVEAIVEAIGVDEPLHLVVHDFGGPIGLAWAVRHPERVRSLAIFNTLFTSTYRWHFWGKVWRAPLIGELSLALMNWPLFRWSIRQGSPHLTDEQLRETYRFVTPKMKRTVLKLYRATDAENFVGWEDELHTIVAQTPTLVLWGRHDPYISRKYAKTFGTDNIRHFPDHGHWLPAEAPAEVAALLREHFSTAR